MTSTALVAITLCIFHMLVTGLGLQQITQKRELNSPIDRYDDSLSQDVDPSGMQLNYAWKDETKIPRRSKEMHGMDARQEQQTIHHMQQFIQNQRPHFATLVLMGDSTMSGLVTEMLNISSEVQNAMEILYVSNDRAQRVRYGCNEGCGGVPPGGEWTDETKVSDFLTKTTVARAQASTRALHRANCNSGGGLETYVFRSGPYKNLVVHHWGFLPEYAEFCWKPCMVEAVAALKPSAVVWNVGFHLLNHDFNPSVCKQRHNPTQPGCGNYKKMVQTASHQMLEAGVEQVVWKHTNWVCEHRQIQGFPETEAALTKWHDESQRGSLEKACQKECPQYEGMSCYDWFFDAHTSERMYHESREALHEVRQAWGSSPVRELDAFIPSRKCCSEGCTQETDDGEHYAGLDSELTVNLARILSQQVQWQVNKSVERP